MRKYRIDDLDAMEKAERRLQEAAYARHAKGGTRNHVRARLMLAGAEELRRERLEKMRRWAR